MQKKDDHPRLLTVKTQDTNVNVSRQADLKDFKKKDFKFPFAGAFESARSVRLTQRLRLLWPQKTVPGKFLVNSLAQSRVPVASGRFGGRGAQSASVFLK